MWACETSGNICSYKVTFAASAALPYAAGLGAAVVFLKSLKQSKTIIGATQCKKYYYLILFNLKSMWAVDEKLGSIWSGLIV